MPVTAADPFPNYTDSPSAPPRNCALITKSDADELPVVTKKIFCGGAGNLHITTVEGQDVLLTGVAAGSIIEIRAKKVWSTNTSTTNMAALY